MKSLFSFLLLLLSFPALSQANNTTLQKWYLDFGGGSASHAGALGTVGLRTILSNNWSFGLSYDNVSMDPKNLPADYRPGVFLLLILPISEGNPSVDVNIFSVTAGKFIPASRRVWFTTDAGFSLVRGTTFQFQPNKDRGGLLDFPSNYTYTEERKTAIGGLLKAEVTWAFSSFVGLSAGVFASINGIQSPVGTTLKLVLGRLNTSKQKR
jgi:hypothetical protein